MFSGITPAMEATILHADLDAFYASVEQLLDPSLRGKPIAVGGGVVLAASYEAKAFGVRGGMPGRRGARALSGADLRRRAFQGVSAARRCRDRVLGDFTPLVERISIDEAFADVAGTAHLFGPPAEIAADDPAPRARRARACRSRSAWRAPSISPRSPRRSPSPTGWWSSIPRRELEFLHALPVELMWGVGPATKARLAAIGVATIGQLAADLAARRSNACSAARRRRSSPRSPGIAIRATSHAPARAFRRRAVGARPQAGEPRACSCRRCAISPTASAAGCARSRARPHRDGAGALRRPALGHALAHAARAGRRRPRSSPRWPRTWCAACSPITPRSAPSRCSRSRCRTWRAGRRCSSSFRSARRRGAPARQPQGRGALARRPRARQDPRPLRLGGGRLRVGGAGRVALGARRIPRARREGAVISKPAGAPRPRIGERYANAYYYAYLAGRNIEIMSRYTGTVTFAGNSEAIRLEKALFSASRVPAKGQGGRARHRAGASCWCR